MRQKDRPIIIGNYRHLSLTPCNALLCIKRLSHSLTIRRTGLPDIAIFIVLDGLMCYRIHSQYCWLLSPFLQGGDLDYGSLSDIQGRCPSVIAWNLSGESIDAWRFHAQRWCNVLGLQPELFFMPYATNSCSNVIRNSKLHEIRHNR